MQPVLASPNRRDVKYGKHHQSLSGFDGKFPTFHMVRIRDLFNTKKKKFRNGDPWLPSKKGAKRRRRNPYYWEWCKWMTILHRPWKNDPWTAGLWGKKSMEMSAVLCC